jgi:hypothetical protein
VTKITSVPVENASFPNNCRVTGNVMDIIENDIIEKLDIL